MLRDTQLRLRHLRRFPRDEAKLFDPETIVHAKDILHLFILTGLKSIAPDHVATELIGGSIFEVFHVEREFATRLQCYHKS